MAHQTLNYHRFVFRSERKRQSLEFALDIILGDLGTLLQQRSRYDYRLTDQRRLEFGVFTQDNHAFLFELLGKDAVDGGRIAKPVLDALNLHGLIANDLKSDV